MKERPILFKGEMVRAILDGRKTQTRRVVKPQAAVLTDEMARALGVQPPAVQNPPAIPCPYGAPGDRLWVREAHALDGRRVFYREGSDEREGIGPRVDVRWRPSIFMPRSASRILLEITDVRVQRLQEISEDDARAEGCSPSGFVPSYNDPDNNAGGPEYQAAADAFCLLWRSINGADSWNANPWVWVITFRRLQP